MLGNFFLRQFQSCTFPLSFLKKVIQIKGKIAKSIKKMKKKRILSNVANIIRVYSLQFFFACEYRGGGGMVLFYLHSAGTSIVYIICICVNAVHSLKSY